MFLYYYFITLIEALSKKNLDLPKVDCVSAEGAWDTCKASECEQPKLQGLFPNSPPNQQKLETGFEKVEKNICNYCTTATSVNFVINGYKEKVSIILRHDCLLMFLL